MEIKEKKNYYDAAMRQITGDSLCLSTYQYLKKNEEWAGRYEDFLKEKKSLPLLYDPFLRRYSIQQREYHVIRQILYFASIK